MLLSKNILFAKARIAHVSGVKNWSTICYTHDLLPPMLARGFRDLRFVCHGPCGVEILFRGIPAAYFSKVLIVIG